MTKDSAVPGFIFILPWDLHHPGGVNQVVINLFEQAARSESVSPIILVNEWDAAAPIISNVDNRITIRYRVRSPWHAKNGLRHLIGFILALPLTLWNFHAITKAYNIAVINFHYPGLGALTALALRWLGLYSGKIIISFHGAEVSEICRSKGFERFLWRLLLGHADVVVTCSENLKEKVKGFAPDRAKLKTIHNGIDFQYFMSNWDRSFEPSINIEKKRLLVNVAAFEEKKGQDVLVNAFSLICPQYSDAHLLMIGADGDFLGYINSLVRKLDLMDRVSIVVDLPHDRIAKYLELSEVFVFPSREESFGIAILEASAFRLPVVATAVGGISEILIHEENGLLVPVNDVTALGKSMDRLLADPDLGEKLGHQLHEHVLRNFSWKKSFEQYVDICKNND